MTTIAKPRDTSVNGRPIPQISTPTSSSRPSLENPRSLEASPNRNSSIHNPTPPSRTRTALREYYNLQKAPPPASSSASSIHDNNTYSEVLSSDLDLPSFNGAEYVKRALETQSLGELLRTYNGVLTDIRALDAEKKALVYDNYSKLIAATETIRKMRSNMDPLNPVASTLDPAIKSVYERAEGIKGEMRQGMSEGERRECELEGEEKTLFDRRRKARRVVSRVLDTPERVRGLIKDDQEEEAARVWEETAALLERWKERGVGGSDVLDCIEDGEAALRGEPPSGKSWVNVKAARESNS